MSTSPDKAGTFLLSGIHLSARRTTLWRPLLLREEKLRYLATAFRTSVRSRDICPREWNPGRTGRQAANGKFSATTRRTAPPRHATSSFERSIRTGERNRCKGAAPCAILQGSFMCYFESLRRLKA